MSPSQSGQSPKKQHERSDLRCRSCRWKHFQKPPEPCRPPAISPLHTTTKRNVIARKQPEEVFTTCPRPASKPTWKGFVGAASDVEQVLDDVLAVGGLATSTFAQQNDWLVLASGQEVPIGCLSQVVNVRGRVLPPAALEHLHHLRGIWEERQEEMLNRRPGLWFDYDWVICDMHRQ